MIKSYSKPGDKWPGVARLAFVALSLIYLSTTIFTATTTNNIDAIRYINYSLNLINHGIISADIFGSADTIEPSLIEGGPVTALELALSGFIDPVSRDFFYCIVANVNSQSNCSGFLLGVKIVNFVEIVLALFFLWSIGRKLFNSDTAAASMVLLALAMDEVTEFAGFGLTEPLYFMLTAALAYFMMRLAEDKVTIGLAALVGIAVGLTTLSKPVAAPLAVLIPLLIVIDALVSRKSLWTAAKLSAAVSFVALVMIIPWILRNHQVSGFASLADPYYLEASLSHRFGYNQMSWAEWAVGWIYYLPDFGDNLARTLFPPIYYERLGWSEEGYYAYGRDILHRQLRSVHGPEPAISYLIENHAFSDTFKYLAVTALLLWRGIMVGTYVGLVAILVLPLVFIVASPDMRRKLIYIVFPGLMIAGLNAGLSVSLTRYNLALVPYYTASIVFIFLYFFRLVRSRQLAPNQ